MGQKKLGLTACRLKALSVGQGWEFNQPSFSLLGPGKDRAGGGGV